MGTSVVADARPWRTVTVHWLEAVYDRQRRHSVIDTQTPVDYEGPDRERRRAA